VNAAQVTIRPITLADVAGFRACVGAVMSERKYLAYLEPFSFTHTAAFVAENLERGNPQIVAEDAGEIVGWCDVRRETIPTYAHEGMLGMGLLPDYRGRGLGERLMRATLEAAPDAPLALGAILDALQRSGVTPAIPDASISGFPNLKPAKETRRDVSTNPETPILYQDNL